MAVVGIVCEYNPLHLGHKKQLDAVRSRFGEDTAIVCAMSGNFVQRGEPAIFDKGCRAEAALACGADLVLELPAAVSLNSAEGFAAGGVEILSRLCDTLCFGAESERAENLMEIAEALLSADFSEKLKPELQAGVSFAAARTRALQAMDIRAEGLTLPNNILGVEYCKAILSQQSRMQPFVISRQGDYHAGAIDPANPSATALRNAILNRQSYLPYVPEPAQPCFAGAKVHALAYGERAILYRLRTMTEVDFEALPFGSEGLWRRLMHAVKAGTGVDEIIDAAKSKRYARSRLQRMVMCAALGITREMIDAPLPYVRVLGFTDRGRELLNKQKSSGFFVNAGQAAAAPQWEAEQRFDDIYGLFAATPDAPGQEIKRRVKYVR